MTRTHDERATSGCELVMSRLSVTNVLMVRSLNVIISRYAETCRDKKRRFGMAVKFQMNYIIDNCRRQGLAIQPFDGSNCISAHKG